MKKNLSTATRDHVALKAGVSSATVSRVYNNPGSVSREKVEMVLQAAESLGYEPNRQASSLRRKRTGNITLIEFKKKNRSYYWGNQPLLKWMYADIVRSILDETSKSMFLLQIQEVENPDELESLARNTDGIIGYDVDTREEAEAIRQLGKPYIICHHTEDLTEYPSVRTDNFTGGRIQAKYLEDRGVKYPLYITGYINEVPADRRRMEGFLDIYSPDSVSIIDNLAGLEEGKARADEVLEKIKADRLDGIACVNDMTLLGIILGGKNTQPAEIFPCIGYDNLPVLPVFPAPPATIDLKLNQIYRTGVIKLLEQISTGRIESECRIIFPELKRAQVLN